MDFEKILAAVLAALVQIFGKDATKPENHDTIIKAAHEITAAQIEHSTSVLDAKTEADKLKEVTADAGTKKHSRKPAAKAITGEGADGKEKPE